MKRNSGGSSQKIEEYKKKVEEYERNMKIVLKERDFYFHKIVAMEKICLSAEHKESGLSNELRKIMYDDLDADEETKQ